MKIAILVIVGLISVIMAFGALVFVRVSSRSDDQFVDENEMYDPDWDRDLYE